MMLPTESLGWNCLQALKSSLSGRLARFTRSRVDGNYERPHSLDNDEAFFEADMRYIFQMKYVAVNVSKDIYHDLDQKARNLLVSLDEAVSSDLIKPSEQPARREAESSKYIDYKNSDGTSHALTNFDESYPRLKALIRWLDTTTDRVNFASGAGSPLFILPRGETRAHTMKSVSEWKALLEKLAADSQRGAQIASKSDTHLSMIKSAQEPGVLQKQTNSVIGAIFREFQLLNCGTPHEIKLSVSEKLPSGEPTLDMFISCCSSGAEWQEAQCGSFEVAIDSDKKDNLCTAVQKSQKQCRKLHLLIHQRGLFDVSDEMPLIPTSFSNYTTETLGWLLDQKRLCRISPRAYLEGTATDSFDSQEKTTLALALARCLMDFFDEELELASHTWNPESIFFLRSPRVCTHSHPLYVSLRPNPSGFNPSTLPATIQVGHPVLLSFARLLLEIDSGEKIPLKVHTRSQDNLAKWGEMCGLLSELEKDRNSFYLKAVKGCLYLHLHLPRSRDPGAANATATTTRKAIHENIVQNLELELNPETLKRKRRYSSSDFPNRPSGKKPFTFEPPGIESQSLPRSLNGDTHRSFNSKPVPPASRNDFEIAIVCALPLEYNAVTLLIDQFWDQDRDPYGRAVGDENIYTTGRIANHDVVLVLLPNIGKVSAASAAASLRSSYPALKLVLLTGVCGGVPNSSDEELLLGDVVISKTVIQYDHGRRYPDGFAIKDTTDSSIGRPTKNIRNLVTIFETDRARERLEERAAHFLQQLQDKSSGRPRRANYSYPGADNDRLFEASFRHMHHLLPKCLCANCHQSSDPVCEDSRKLSCDELGCDHSFLVPRDRLKANQQLERDGLTKEAQAPSIFVGAVGSGDMVLKSGEDRDSIAKHHKILAFEMEGAGVWDEIPSIVVKGICDYADSHKNKNWQAFAAATAASVAKAVLERYTQRINHQKGSLP
ncbi:hypothetical protein EDB80DRAFT_636630 [Ilyonectria destructans]|nr:hypothetical protein EDB80DRAFT_636630 [Ilyonectria destructans]